MPNHPEKPAYSMNYFQSEDEMEFIKAIEEYKKRADRRFPTWSEVLHVVKSLGYRKVDQEVPVDPTSNGHTARPEQA